MSESSTSELALRLQVPESLLAMLQSQFRTLAGFAVQSGLSPKAVAEIAGQEIRPFIEQSVREGYATPEEGLADLLEAEGGCVSVPEATKLFRRPKPVVPQLLNRKIGAGELIAYRSGGGAHMVPVWQFKRTGGLIDGLPEALAALRKKVAGADPLTPFAFFLQENPLTGGRTPLETLKSGDQKNVMKAIEAWAG